MGGNQDGGGEKKRQQKEGSGDEINEEGGGGYGTGWGRAAPHRDPPAGGDAGGHDRSADAAGSHNHRGRPSPQRGCGGRVRGGDDRVTIRSHHAPGRAAATGVMTEEEEGGDKEEEGWRSDGATETGNRGGNKNDNNNG